MFNKAGLAVQVASSPTSGQIPVVLTSNVSAATAFLFKPCNDPTTSDPSCVSLSPADKPGWYNRHSNYIWYDELASTALLPLSFPQDSSFILHRDTFYAGYFALESVNFPTYYIHSEPDGFLRVVFNDGTQSFFDAASFRLMDAGLPS